MVLSSCCATVSLFIRLDVSSAAGRVYIGSTRKESITAAMFSTRYSHLFKNVFVCNMLLFLGSAEYASLIREKMMSFIDILDAFPSTMPSLNVVLEGLPRLQPRSYSVTR